MKDRMDRSEREKNRYACVFEDETGGRCQQWAIEAPAGVFLFCKGHLAARNPKLPPKPNWILIKLSGGPNFLEYLQRNFPDLEHKGHDWHADNRRHGETAEEAGRDPHRFDQKRNDDGVPIFGKQGVPNVGDMDRLVAEIEADGYWLNNVHWFHRVKPDKRRSSFVHGAVVVCGFTNDPSRAKPTDVPGRELMEELMKSGWQFVPVWANPPKNGGVTHTVNCNGRQEGRGEKNDNIIRFLHGFWYMAPRGMDISGLENILPAS